MRHFKCARDKSGPATAAVSAGQRRPEQGRRACQVQCSACRHPAPSTVALEFVLDRQSDKERSFDHRKRYKDQGGGRYARRGMSQNHKIYFGKYCGRCFCKMRAAVPYRGNESGGKSFHPLKCPGPPGRRRCAGVGPVATLPQRPLRANRPVAPSHVMSCMLAGPRFEAAQTPLAIRANGRLPRLKHLHVTDRCPSHRRRLERGSGELVAVIRMSRAADPHSPTW
jgi:hypothetical protein